ncbi:MAG: Adaptive-response sensory-kinase SasA [Planctomycetes bacterium]|nr:Adaptive-response sensory-kinase SasA [Planctomycetota bacterium]
MSLINVREKTIQAKIVYYGTALSGKTTSLKHVHTVIDPDRRVELVSLNTEGDRTFFFDFLPIPLGNVHGYQLKLQAFTVPGQVKYNLTRRYVLRGADAVIFVADSSPAAREDNLRSLESLRENLAANGLSPDATPLVFQWNKRDAPGALPVEDLRALLNSRGDPDFESTATSGAGVFEAFTAVACRTVERIAKEYRVGSADEARTAVERRLRATHQTWRGTMAAREAAADEATQSTGTVTALANAVEQPGAQSAVIEVSSADVPDIPNAETLLRHAVETNIESARLVAELTETRRRLSDHVRQLAALHQTGVALASELDVDRLLDRVLTSVLRTVDTHCGSVLLLDDSGALRQRVVHGLARDPIAEARADEIRGRIDEQRPFVLQIDAGADMMDVPAAGETVPMAAIVAPLVHQREVLGAIIAYVLERPLDQDLRLRAKFLGAVASQAAVALVNARLYARVEGFNRELERKVAERTRDIERAVEELRALDRMKDDFLASMSHELLTPLQSIAGAGEILGAMAAETGSAAAEERAEFAGVVVREAARLTAMLQQVLELSQLEAGKAALSIEGVNLRDAVLESHKRIRPQFKAAHAKLHLRVEQGLPLAMADPSWIGRVLDALLSNAVKFGREGGHVSVTLRADGGAVRVEVGDDGPGVPEALREMIFEKFKQLGDVLTEKPQGLGLGLPMCACVISALGGRIWHEPAPDGGSIFGFTLPASDEEPASSVHAQTIESPASSRT